jgi:hypothetical protein
MLYLKLTEKYTSQVEHKAGAIKINTLKNIILCKKEHNATRGKT